MAGFLLTVVTVTLALLALTGLLHLFPKLGPGGRAVSEACTRAPLLDLLIVAFQIAPIVGGAIYAGWAGVAGALVGMLITYTVWVRAHEAINRRALRRERIVTTLNRIAGGGLRGKLRNHAAVWSTALALPVFWFVRAGEVLVYPLLVVLVDFPRYKANEWIVVSRHKFEGLVGHDLIWCLYCDWMTGVYSLGAEMLRNVESYWCPIRFYPDKKCDNCALDFPDVNDGWIPADGTMEQVTETLEKMYADGRRGWFGHPARLTIEGEPTPSTDATT